MTTTINRWFSKQIKLVAQQGEHKENDEHKLEKKNLKKLLKGLCFLLGLSVENVRLISFLFHNNLY